MSQTESQVQYKSPLHQMTQTTPTCLWNDSANIEELTYSIENGAVGATCNPSIAVTVLKQEMPVWKPRILELAKHFPQATEDEIAWMIVEEMSANAAKLLKPIFDREHGRNGRLSIQTDPRLYRNTAAIVEQACRFSALAPNMIVKIPVTHAGVAAIEHSRDREARIRGFTAPQLAEIVLVVRAAGYRPPAHQIGHSADAGRRAAIPHRVLFRSGEFFEPRRDARAR